MESLTDQEQLAWLIAIGEERGGEWNYRRGRWTKRPQPPAVIAIPGKMN